MNIGDLVIYCDGFYGEPVILLRLCDPEEDTDNEALVVNEHGEHWVPLDDLVPIDEVMEMVSECG